MPNNSLYDIKKDIKKRYMRALDNLAEELSFEIENAYETIIERFYNDYSPISYNRTYSTYLASDSFENPFSYTQMGNTYFSGINIDPSFINGKPYRADTGWVFERTFEKGIHGINRNTVINRNKKRYGDDVWKVKHIPKNMKPAPKQLMDKEFKRITRKSNLDRMFNEQLNKSFN